MPDLGIEFRVEKVVLGIRLAEWMTSQKSLRRGTIEGIPG